MAKLELNKIVASSLDNFIIFNNENSQESPFVYMHISDSCVGQNITIVFSDADNDDGVSYTVKGAAGNYITQSTFNTAGDRYSVMYSLCECLKLNSFAYNVIIYNTNTVKFEIDSSRRWTITSTSAGMVDGNYSQYNPYDINKFVVNVRAEIEGSITQFAMAKYNDAPEVSFNMTSPFQYTTFKHPINISLNAYSVIGNSTSMETLTNTFVTVMPTTLSKFETVDYNDYFCSQYNVEKKYFLTRNFNRIYNYGEYVGLSILTDRSDAYTTLTKKYYTNSGSYLTSSTGYVYRDVSNNRMDFYDTFDIESVESNTGHQVGYVEVVAVSQGGDELTYPIRFEVQPRCGMTDTLFYINAIGGLESFTFMGGVTENSSIDEITIYRKNPKKPYEDTYELDFVKQKSMDDTVTVKTHRIDRTTAQWLKELQKSRYVFKFLGSGDPKFKMVVIESFDIELPSDERRFELECTYRYADSSINI